MDGPILEAAGVSKNYGALRPLRIEHLDIHAGEAVAIVGLEQGAAEILVNLFTGATLPDAGEVRIFGRSTAAIADSTDWLSIVDRFGIVSDRGVLLDQLTVVQNLAMPYTLDVEPPSADVRARAEALAREVGLDASVFDRRVGSIDPVALARIRLGRAVAVDPEVLLLEHPTATLGRGAAEEFGRDVRSVAARRGAAVFAATADETFAAAVASRVFVHNAATGGLAERRRGWFSRRIG